MIFAFSSSSWRCERQLGFSWATKLEHDVDILHDSAHVASVKQILENCVLITAFNLLMELRENA